MPEIVIPYKPRKLQKFLHEKIDKSRFSVCVLHRRAGKTVCMINHMIRAALTNPLPSPRYAFISPTFKQGKATAWDYIKQFAGKIPGTRFNESELRCDLPNGSRITILGAENDQSLRGIFLDGFIGTTKGRNYFYELYQDAKDKKDWFACLFKASETGILDQEELDAAKSIMSEDLYEQEFECSFQAAITGSYYGALIEKLEAQNRISEDLYDDSLDVETWWDLGLNDSTSIWFAQRYKGEIRLIDYYENAGMDLDHYAQILDQKGYEYSKHIFPHDVKVRELGNYGKSRLESLLELGIVGEVAPKLSIEDGIEAVRKALPNCWFDKNKCQQGIEHLKAYQKKWDDKNQCFRNKPMHNFASHTADAFRTGIIGDGAEVSDWKEDIPVNTNYIV